MQSEKTIKVDRARRLTRPRNRYRRTHIVIRTLAVRYHNVESVSRTALEETYERLSPGHILQFHSVRHPA
jgi:hypothetical protein